MAGRKKDVTVDLIVDDKQKSKLKGIGDEAGKTSSKLDTIAKAGLGLVAGAAIKNFADDSVRAFSDLNESMNAVDVSFGSSAEGIKSLGRDAADSLGLSNAAFNTFAVQFSAFAEQIAGDGVDVVDVVDELSTRVSDFASVMNLDVAEAATLFQSGLAGETEPLRKYGVDLSAAAVNAHAMAEGIGVAGEQLTEQEKVLARHSLLMKQTNKVAGDFVNTQDEFANATRRANAEIENNKAIIGEALVPAYEAALPLMAHAAKTLGFLSVGFMDLTGDISPAAAAVREFELLSGQSADTLAAAVTINKEYGTSFQDLIPSMGLTGEALQQLDGDQQTFLLSLGYTQEEIKELNGLLETELVRAGNEARLMGTLPLADSMGEVTTETGEATTALQEWEVEVRSQIDPAFALIRALQDQKEAQQDVVEAEGEFTRDSPEYVEALLGQVEAGLDVKAAVLGVAEQSSLTRAEWDTQLIAMGVTAKEQREIILAELEKINAFKVDGKSITIRSDARSGARAAGGPVRAGSSYLVGEAGPEVVTMGSQGSVTPNHRLRSGGGSETIIIQVDGREIARAVRNHDRSLLPG